MVSGIPNAATQRALLDSGLEVATHAHDFRLLRSWFSFQCLGKKGIICTAAGLFSTVVSLHETSPSRYTLNRNIIDHMILLVSKYHQ